MRRKRGTAMSPLASPFSDHGANSRLRELVTPIRPDDVGVSLVEGLAPGAKQMAPELWDLLGGSALIALGGEITIGMGTKPDGSVLLYAGVKTRGDSARRSFERCKRPGPAS